MDSVGSHNTELRIFAFDAYDVLSSWFGSEDWKNWYMLNFLEQGDDTNQVLNLGIFVEDST